MIAKSGVSRGCNPQSDYCAILKLQIFIKIKG